MRLLPVIALFVTIGAAAQDDDAVVAGDRTVPLPAAASTELQESIRAWPRPDVTASRNAPSTDEEWLDVKAGNDERWRQNVVKALERTAIDVDDTVIAGVRVFRLTPPAIAAENRNRLFIYLHGGAYVFGRGQSGLGEAIMIADRLRIEVVSIDYRMPPRDPFPAALDDAVAAYRQIVADVAAGSIALGGTSAGGGLALATVLRLRQLGVDLPGALYLGTPWADLTKTGDTLFTNEGLDRILVTYDGSLGAAARLYAGEQDLHEPLLSPVYGEFAGFPPTILVTGTRDMFLSDVARTHRKLRAAGVTADLHVFEGLSHAGYIAAPDTPESRDTYAEIAAFLARHLE